MGPESTNLQPPKNHRRFRLDRVLAPKTDKQRDRVSAQLYSIWCLIIQTTVVGALPCVRLFSGGVAKEISPEKTGAPYLTADIITSN